MIKKRDCFLSVVETIQVILSVIKIDRINLCDKP